MLWWWAVPAAWLWSIAANRQAILPLLPSWVWSGPGALWRAAPVGYVAILALATWLVGTAATRVHASGRTAVRIAVTLAAALTMVNIVWGTALLVQ